LTVLHSHATVREVAKTLRAGLPGIQEQDYGKNYRY
jgi:hypothetical protein